MSSTIVLAFSGGLDTSFCLWQLRQAGHHVHTVFVDTGGVSREERQRIETRAHQLGATRHWTLDAGQDLWDEFVIPLVWSHGRASEQYPLLCSDRYVIVRKCLEICQQIGTSRFAHGCTGMGNDQLRFDQTVRSLGDFEIVAPIRDLQSRVQHVRAYEMEQLAAAGIEVPQSNCRYSINENLLGVTVSGGAIDQFGEPEEDTWCRCALPQHWPREARDVKIEFHHGVATRLNGQAMSGPALLSELNQLLGAYGIGRQIYTGDVSIGLKGRIVFECPGITGLLTAHRALEDAVNTRWQNQFRHHVSNRWAELVYTGFFYEPHKRDLEAYLASSQQNVSGTVTLQANGGLLLPTIVDSPNLLVAQNAVYAQSCDWTPDEAVGFIKLLGQSSTLSARIHGVASDRAFQGEKA